MRPTRVEHGLAVYGEIRDRHRNTVRVQESSAASEDSAWIFVRDELGRRVYMHMGEPTAPAPHLTRTQARAVAVALLRFSEGISYAEARRRVRGAR